MRKTGFERRYGLFDEDDIRLDFCDRCRGLRFGLLLLFLFLLLALAFSGFHFYVGHCSKRCKGKSRTRWGDASHPAPFAELNPNPITVMKCIKLKYPPSK